MRAGYASADITPTQPGITLSGFAARRNQPSEGIDDPLSVHALIVEETGETVLLLVFDLLGLGPEITEQINGALDRLPGLDIPRPNRILCCTHTHSAPATVKLIGCGVEDPAYWDTVVRGAVEAARCARESVCPAKLRYATVPVEGLSYNRRKTLEDGRVVMAQFPNEPVRKEGPVWGQFLLVRFEDESENGICGIAHWAAHACTVGGMRISADYPGRLRELLAAHHGLPFIFLQGACGNINPPLGDMTRDQMLRNAEAVAEKVAGVEWPPPVDPRLFDLAASTLRLGYGPIPTDEDLRELSSGMAAVAETGDGPPEAVALLANILNVKPGDEPDPETMRHIASLVREWSEGLLTPPNSGVILNAVKDLRRGAEILRAAQNDDAEILRGAQNDMGGGATDGCDLSLKVWRIGPLVFCFIAAEVFVETAIALWEAFPDLIVNAVGYASPLVGYLPTDEALAQGGYEAGHAFLFYGHPAAFAKGSEPAVVRAIAECIRGS